MAIAEYDSISAVSISTSEISIISGTTTLQDNTTDGVYQLVVDASNMAKADEFRIKIYDACLSGGTKRIICQWTLLGVQSELFVSPTLILLHKWDMTLQKIAGTDRAFTASIRQVA